MNELSDLLPRAAGDDLTVGFDHTDIQLRVARHARQRRARALASIVAVILLGAGVVALAGQGDGRDEGVYADDGTGPVTAEELTRGPWLAVALSEITVGSDATVFMTFEGDRFVTHDGCTVSSGKWELTTERLRGTRLWLTDRTTMGQPDCPAGGTSTSLLGDILEYGPSVGRPDGAPGTLELRSAQGFVTFERFDRLGRVPTATDILGPWTLGSDDPDSDEEVWQATFRDDGIVESTDFCPLLRSWSMDGERLVIRDDQDEPESNGVCGILRVSADHDVFDGATRVRLGGPFPWAQRLWLDVGGVVVFLERPPADTAPPG